MNIASSIKDIDTQKRDSLFAIIHNTSACIYYKHDLNIEALQEIIKGYNFAIKAQDYEATLISLGLIADIKAFFGKKTKA